MLVAFVSFTLASVLVVLLPGPDSLVVVRGLVRGGRPGGARTAAGVLGGLVVWIAATALGLSALLQASEVGYAVLKVVGACYLVWIGVRSLLSVRRTSAQVATAGDGPMAPAPMLGGSGFSAGFLTDLLNPKVGVFFVTFLPGFVPHGYPVGLVSLLLGAVFVLLTTGYFVLLLTFASRLATWMATPRVRRRMDAITGAVLLGFGVRLAVES